MCLLTLYNNFCEEDWPGLGGMWSQVGLLQGALGLSGGAWSANWQITKSTKCVHLLRRLIDIGAVPDCPSPQVSLMSSSIAPSGLPKRLVQLCVSWPVRQAITVCAKCPPRCNQGKLKLPQHEWLLASTSFITCTCVEHV